MGSTAHLAGIGIIVPLPTLAGIGISMIIRRSFIRSSIPRPPSPSHLQRLARWRQELEVL